MIRISEPPQRPEPSTAWHDGFLAMLPEIRRRASLAFRNLPKVTREDLIEEVVVNALVVYKRLYDQGKVELAYPTVLARYGIRQVNDGRRVGSKLNVKDVSSKHCQQKKGFALQRLDRFDKYEGVWLEAVAEDRRTPVPDQVWFRIDFPQWLNRLSTRDRRIAEALAAGSRPGEVAAALGVYPAKISRKRREFHDSWRAFHGETGPAAQAVAVPA